MLIRAPKTWFHSSARLAANGESCIPKHPHAVFGILAENDKAPIIRPLSDASSKAGLMYRSDSRSQAACSPNHSTLIMPEPLSKCISNMTFKWNPQDLRQEVSALYKRLSSGVSHCPASESIEVEAQIVGFFLQNYAALTNVLSEAKKRLPDWKPKTVLDIGFGPATGILAANGLFGNELLRKVAIIFGHPRMSRRAAELLSVQEEEGGATRTVIRHAVPLTSSTTRYDLVIATHQLYESSDMSQGISDNRARRLAQLLAPGGVLILIERGDPFGFESIARARQVLLRPEDRNNVARKFVNLQTTPDSEPVALKIIAPCSHHGVCPLQMGLFTRQAAQNPAGQKWCRFEQVVQRPRFTVELKKGQYLSQKWVETEERYGRGPGGKSLAGSGRPYSVNMEKAGFSYLVIQRARKEDLVEDKLQMRNESVASNQLAAGSTSSLYSQTPAPVQPIESASFDADLPRIMRNPIKRKGHVTMEVCAPSGNIEHWTVPASFGQQAYRDARKSHGGDLWALGAKTVQLRGGLKKQPLSQEPSKPPKSSQSRFVDHWEARETQQEEGTLLGSLQTLLDYDERRVYKLDNQRRQRVYRHWS